MHGVSVKVCCVFFILFINLMYCYIGYSEEVKIRKYDLSGYREGYLYNVTFERFIGFDIYIFPFSLSSSSDKGDNKIILEDRRNFSIGDLYYMFSNVDFESKSKCDGVCLYYVLKSRSGRNQDLFVRFRKYVFDFGFVIKRVLVNKAGDGCFDVVLLREGASELYFYKLCRDSSRATFVVKNAVRVNLSSLLGSKLLTVYDFDLLSLVNLDLVRSQVFPVEGSFVLEVEDKSGVKEYYYVNYSRNFEDVKVNKMDIKLETHNELFGSMIFNVCDNTKLFLVSNYKENKNFDTVYVQKFSFENIFMIDRSRLVIYDTSKYFDLPGYSKYYHYFLSPTFHKIVNVCPRLSEIQRWLMAKFSRFKTCLSYVLDKYQCLENKVLFECNEENKTFDIFLYDVYDGSSFGYPLLIWAISSESGEIINVYLLKNIQKAEDGGKYDLKFVVLGGKL